MFPLSTLKQVPKELYKEDIYQGVKYNVHERYDHIFLSKEDNHLLEFCILGMIHQTGTDKLHKCLQNNPTSTSQHRAMLLFVFLMLSSLFFFQRKKCTRTQKVFFALLFLKFQDRNESMRFPSEVDLS